MKSIKLLLIAIFFMLLPVLIAPSCDSNKGQLIPYVKVDVYLLLYADLADLGIQNSKMIQGGVNGILLYRESHLEFYAYDRTCTLWPAHNEAVVEDSTFFGVFECPDCKSTYLMLNGGAPNSGPAQFPLVQYNTSLSGDVLHIYN